MLGVATLKARAAVTVLLLGMTRRSVPAERSIPVTLKVG